MPKCHRCSKEVYFSEEVSQAGNKWHKECFRCKTCGTALSSVNVRDNAGEIYCDQCYGKNFGAKGYGFGGGGGVGLQSGKYEGAEPLHGTAAIDAELQRKLNLKYNPEKEEKAKAWLEAVLKTSFEEKTLQESLKSGVRLCTVMNIILEKWGARQIAKINQGGMAALQRENISNYLKACKTLAIESASIFETSDLYEGKNMVKVVENIVELAKKAEKKGLPSIGIASGASEAFYAASSSAPEPEAKEAPAAPAAAPAAAAPAPAAAPAAAAPAPAAAASSGAKVENCPDCGAARAPDSSFCPDCGHKFDE